MNYSGMWGIVSIMISPATSLTLTGSDKRSMLLNEKDISLEIISYLLHFVHLLSSNFLCNIQHTLLLPPVQHNIFIKDICIIFTWSFFLIILFIGQKYKYSTCHGILQCSFSRCFGIPNGSYIICVSDKAGPKLFNVSDNHMSDISALMRK